MRSGSLLSERLASLRNEKSISNRDMVKRYFRDSSREGTYSAYVDKHPLEVAKTRFLCMIALKPKGKICLSLGCGLGGYLRDYLRNGAKEVVGVDINIGNLHECKEIGAELILGDIDDLPIRDGVVDAMECVETMQYVPNPGAVVGEMRRIINENDGISFVTWKHYDWLDALDHDTRWRLILGIRDLILDSVPFAARNRMISCRVLSRLLKGYRVPSHSRLGFSFAYLRRVYYETRMQVIHLRWVRKLHSIIVVAGPMTVEQPLRG